MVSRLSVGRAVAAVVLLAALGTGCGGDDTPSAAEPFARLDPAAFAARSAEKDAVLINVHIPYEGELEQTDAFIPYDKIVGDSRLPADKNSEILLYCRSGRMSEIAGDALHAAGYTKLSHLEGGMLGWEAAGRPLIQNPAHAT
jgi:rhodanese-related sulfurtransferase